MAPGLLLQAAPQPGGSRRPLSGETVRVGFTASRKVGNAVIRNRAKRRLRAAAAQVLTTGGRPGTDYVLIARAGTATRPYAALVADLEPDIVLLDVMMPGMDGLEATRRIRIDARFASLPIIAITAKAMKDDQEQTRLAGMTDYLAKPIDLDRLYSLLRVWLPSRERMRG